MKWIRSLSRDTVALDISHHMPISSHATCTLTFKKAFSELEEQLQIIKALWREETVTFNGTYHQVANATCQPRPEPLPPVFVAAHQPRMMRVAARYADWWNTGISSPDEAREKVQALDAACASVGRDPRTLRRTAMITSNRAKTPGVGQHTQGSIWSRLCGNTRSGGRTNPSPG